MRATEIIDNGIIAERGYAKITLVRYIKFVHDGARSPVQGDKVRQS